MEELTQEDDDAAAATVSPRATGQPAGERRRLCVMRSGARLFAIYADEVEATSENLRPTPLPFAPAPVRGVVSQRGRILTVIDPFTLLPPDPPSTGAPADAPAFTPPASPPVPETHAPLVVALRGDEQLALSVERIEHNIELFDDDETDTTSHAAASSGSHLLRRIIRHHTRAIPLLNTAHLFEAAMQGVERRRRRQ